MVNICFKVITLITKRNRICCAIFSFILPFFTSFVRFSVEITFFFYSFACMCNFVFPILSLLNNNELDGQVPERLYSIGVHGGVIEYVFLFSCISFHVLPNTILWCKMWYFACSPVLPELLELRDVILWHSQSSDCHKKKKYFGVFTPYK